ncbi:ABC transporter ATP-binding protein [Actinomyces weissii]|uniref:ABC transporter ATP-binding protein n=2 Tax=Actinomyces weissii TaxID=675090 RepID=A0A7T7S2U1_9ACTO|nr:ABC transporter ATP-binding protein [Actinomyces weissii]
MLCEVGLRVLEPWPMKVAIDSVLASLGASTGYAPATVLSLTACGLALVLLVAGRAGASYLSTIAFTLVGARSAASLRARAFAHVQGLSQQFHARNRSADTVQRLVGDVARMQEVATTAGLPLCANTATLLVMLGVMVWLDPLLAVVVVAAVACFLLASSRGSRQITTASQRTRSNEAQLANTAQETLSAIRVVQAYGLEPLLLHRFQGANQRCLGTGVRARRLSARLERSTDLIAGVATAVVLTGGGLRVMQGGMTVGDLVLFTTYLRTTMKPLRDLAKYTGRVARAAASGELVADLLAVQPTITSPAHPLPTAPVRGRLSLQQVRAAYDGHEVIHGVSLAVAPGEHVALVGPSGSGKSTLASLLSRENDPTGGQVLLDHQPVSRLSLNELRACVSVLHQDPVLFTGTIRDNIRLGLVGASDEQVEQAARDAGAHEFICAQPQGYDTELGERGATLSGGQRQRVAIARALLRAAPVVVLDEPTTGLDSQAATQVLQAVERLCQGRTAVLVTHDPLVALRADRVVWLEEGQVALQGPPAELLVSSTRFREWVQQGGSVPRTRAGSRRLP